MRWLSSAHLRKEFLIMNKNAMDSSLGFALTVSAVCCPVEAEENPTSIAQYCRLSLSPYFIRLVSRSM